MLPGILIVIKIMKNVVNLYNVDSFDLQVFVDGLISEITIIGKTKKKRRLVSQFSQVTPQCRMHITSKVLNNIHKYKFVLCTLLRMLHKTS